MSQSLCLVVNPAASRGKGKRRLPEILGVLATAGVPVRVCETAGLGHAALLAEQAAGQGETVIAVGGDGLVGTLASAVSKAGGTLGIIPAGRGNDFARMLGIPAHPVQAAAIVLAGQRQPTDLIGVRSGQSAEQIVAGSVYLGVVSEGGEIANRSRWIRGAIGYQAAGVRALWGWQPASFTVAWGENTGSAGPTAAPEPDVTFPGFCIVVANSAYLAAGKKAAPGADIGDGLLDVLMVGQASKLSFINVMLKAGRGTHVRLPQVHMRRAAQVSVTTDRAMPAAADGETLASAAPLAPGTPLRIRALPGALQVLAPPRNEPTNSGLADSSAGVPSIRTSPPPST